jgi:hypothetical protein
MNRPATAPADNTTLSANLLGIGLLGPGLPDWPSCAPILAGALPYLPMPTVLPPAALLPPAERRRVGSVVKLALAVGMQATTAAGVDAASLATVFTSSTGDGHNCHQICEALASNDRLISPTRFHNSVHNAAAGYWSIATGATGPSNVLGAFDASFGAGLLEAMVQVAVEHRPVLLVAYDSDYPEPLRTLRPVPDSFGIALLLAPPSTKVALARLDVALGKTSNPAPDTLSDAALEALRRTVPAARGLPLLAALARLQHDDDRQTVILEYLDDVALHVGLQF